MRAAIHTVREGAGGEPATAGPARGDVLLKADAQLEGHGPRHRPRVAVLASP